MGFKIITTAMMYVMIQLKHQQWQGRAGQGRAGQGRAGQGRVGQGNFMYVFYAIKQVVKYMKHIKK